MSVVKQKTGKVSPKNGQLSEKIGMLLQKREISLAILLVLFALCFLRT